MLQKKPLCSLFPILGLQNKAYNYYKSRIKYVFRSQQFLVSGANFHRLEIPIAYFFSVDVLFMAVKGSLEWKSGGGSES